MKKTGSRRGSGYESGPGSAVLEAPESGYASEAEGRWQGRGPAPAGALQRGYGSGGYAIDEDAGEAGYGTDEPEYVPRRGNLRLRWHGLPRSVGGRILLGVAALGLLGAVAVAIAGVRFYLMHDPRFVVSSSDDIQIEGADHLTRDQVLNVFGADLERNIFRVSLGERKSDLERLPWVGHATVMRLLPNHLRVQITERTPVAFVRQGSQIGLVDAGGVLLDMPLDAAGDPHYSFPVLTGLSADMPLQTRAARMEIYRRFMKELEGAGGHLTDSLSEVDVSNPEDVKALIASGSSDILVHFGSEDFLKRYREFEQHLPEWKQQYPKLASADVRYEGQIVLEMQDGAGVTPASDGVASAPPAASGVPAAASAKTAAVKPTARVSNPKAKVVAASVVTPITTTPAAAKPGAAKVVAAKVIAKKPAVKKWVPKKALAKKNAAAGKSRANEKEFAALAAAHRAALAKAATAKTADSGGPRVAGGVTR